MTPPDTGVACTLRNARGMRVTVSLRDASLLSWWAPDRYGRMADVLVPAMQPPLSMDWRCDAVTDASLALSRSCDGVLQYLDYRLDDDGSLQVDGESVAAPFFNLQGGADSGVGDHVLALAADRYFPGEAAGGEPFDVAGSAFDFRQSAPIGARLAWPGAYCAGGFDHIFCLSGGGQLHEAACVADPASGRVLHFLTGAPQLHLRTDDRGFSMVANPLAQQLMIYRLGVADIDALGMIKTKEQT